MRLHQIRKNSNRALVSEVLPYELPLPFDNQGLYQLLRHLKFEWVSRKKFRVSKTRLSKSNELWLQTLFDKSPITIDASSDKWVYFTISIGEDKARNAYPYKYTTRRNNGKPRELTVIHPHSMLDMARFIDKYRDSILYYTNRSAFSIRHPHRVARLEQTRDRTFRKNKDPEKSSFEQYNLEYDHISSYFTYKRYNNIYRFYDSSEFRACERKYPTLLRVDIAKCFDSIYTHTISWVTNGWESSKNRATRRKTETTFGGLFDAHIQSLNYGETSGIVIGPEFSRIFAEIILQEVDVSLERHLAEQYKLIHGVDYEILRYVDDYFIFLSDPGDSDKIYNALEQRLTHFKLHLNDKKTELLQTPLRSHVSIAKYRVYEDLRRLTTCEVNLEDEPTGKIYFPGNKALIEYKSALLDSELEHGEIANYYLHSLEQVMNTSCKKFIKYIRKLEELNLQEKSRSAKSSLAKYFVAVIDLALFIYAGAPSASHSIKLSRIIVAALNTLRSIEMPFAEFTSFSDKIQRELRSQLIAVRDEKEFGLHTLNIIDCLTHLGSRLSSDEMYTIIQKRNIEVKDLDALAVLTFMRHCTNRAESGDFRVDLLKRATAIIKLGNTDPKYETERAILLLSIPGSPNLNDSEVRSITGFSRSDSRVLRKSKINPLFDWSVDKSYYEKLLLKSARAVY